MRNYAETAQCHTIMLKPFPVYVVGIEEVDNYHECFKYGV